MAAAAYPSARSTQRLSRSSLEARSGARLAMAASSYARAQCSRRARRESSGTEGSCGAGAVSARATLAAVGAEPLVFLAFCGPAQGGKAAREAQT